MPVLIKEVDPTLYAHFKAKAVQLGLKIDEAFSEAIKLWIQSSEPKLTPREKKQEKNILAYRLLRNTLESDYLGKWIAIADGQLIANSDSKDEIIKVLQELKKNDDPALLFRVRKEQRRVTLGFREIKR